MAGDNRNDRSASNLAALPGSFFVGAGVVFPHARFQLGSFQAAHPTSVSWLLTVGGHFIQLCCAALLTVNGNDCDLFLRSETVGIRRLSAVFAGFCGVLVIVAPWNESFDPHVVLSLVAVLCVSGYFVMSRRVAGVDNNAIMQFYTSGIATALLTPAVWVLAPMSFDSEIKPWLVAALVGSLGMLGHSMLYWRQPYILKRFTSSFLVGLFSGKRPMHQPLWEP